MQVEHEYFNVTRHRYLNQENKFVISTLYIVPFNNSFKPSIHSNVCNKG
jgi:hypothetical protein